MRTIKQDFTYNLQKTLDYHLRYKRHEVDILTDKVDKAVFPWMRHKCVPIPKLSNHKKDTKGAPYHNVLTSSWNMSAPLAADHHQNQF